MTSASEVFHRAIRALLAFDVDAYAETFAPDGVIEWPFAPADWPHRRVEGRDQIRAVVGANLERSRAAGRRLVAIHDVVMHEGTDERDLVVEFTVEVRGPDGASARLPYVHVLRTTVVGRIAWLRDYFGVATAQVARSGAVAEATRLPAEDRLAIHELIALHGHLVDSGPLDHLDRLFTRDVTYDLGDFGLGTVCGLAALRALSEERPGDQPRGHHVTNVVVEPASDGSAHVRSKGVAVMPTGRAGTVVYQDEVVKTTAGWRIRQRKVCAVPD